MTPTEFDKEVSAAYKADRFHIKRMSGLLDVYDAWEGILQYSNFGPSRSNDDAIAQGRKDPSPHSFRFTKGVSDGKMTVLMQYKYHELEQQWHPHDADGIPVFPEDFPPPEDILESTIPLLTPEIWDLDAVKNKMMRVWKFDERQHAEWERFFNSVPMTTDDIEPADTFKWTLPELVARKKTFRNSVNPTVSEHKKSESRPPVEVVVWSKNTKKTLNEEKRLRRIQYMADSNDSVSSLDDDNSSQTTTSSHSMTTRARSNMLHVSFIILFDV